MNGYNGDFIQGLNGNASDDWNYINVLEASEPLNDYMNDDHFAHNNICRSITDFRAAINDILGIKEEDMGALLSQTERGQEINAKLNEVLEKITMFDNMKDSLPLEELRKGIDIYNDNVEMAKLEAIGRKLYEEAIAWNRKNVAIAKYEYDIYDEVTGEPTGSKGYYYTYDQIDDASLWNRFVNWLGNYKNLDECELMRELRARERGVHCVRTNTTQYTTIPPYERRPEWAKYE